MFGFGKKDEGQMHSTVEDIGEEHFKGFAEVEEAMKAVKNEIDVNVASNTPFAMVLLFDPENKVIINKIIRKADPARDNPN